MFPQFTPHPTRPSFGVISVQIQKTLKPTSLPLQSLYSPNSFITETV